MATVTEHVHDTTIGAGYRYWDALVNWLEEVSPWLVVAAYGVLYTVLLLGSATAALYLGTILPRLVGALAFFTIGMVIIAAAPTATRIMFERIIEATGDAATR